MTSDLSFLLADSGRSFYSKSPNVWQDSCGVSLNRLHLLEAAPQRLEGHLEAHPGEVDSENIFLEKSNDMWETKLCSQEMKTDRH